MQKIKPVFIIVFFFLFGSLMAQDLTTAQKWIKAGNSLREAHLYQQSENYLLKGIKAVRQLQNKYWEAVASEYIGLLYYNTEDVALANQYFNNALRLYQSQKMQLSASALKTIMNDRDITTVNTWQLYGGIDIGSKGVKYSIIKVRRREGHFSFVYLRDGSKNTQIIDFTPEAVQETCDAVKVFLDTITNYSGGIKPENIFIAVSSGVKQEADKALGREDAIKLALTKAVPNYKKTIELLDVCTEGELTIKGVVPSDYLYSSSLVDIGSGNTKGGYRMKDTKATECFSLPWGTATLSKRVSGMTVPKIQKFFNDSVNSRIITEIARKPGLTNRKYTFFVGGIFWAMCNYLYPGKIKEDFTEVTAQDVDRYVNAAINNYEALIKPDLSAITDITELEEANKQVERTRTTFTQDDIIAGAMMVKSILYEIQRSGIKEKHFLFSRYAYVGWISGYIVQKVDDDFSKMSDAETP